MEKEVFNDDIDIDTQDDVQESGDSQDKDAEIAKLKAIAKRRKEKIEELTKSEDTPTKEEPKDSQPVTGDEKFERLELKVEGYSDSEINLLMEYGGKKMLANPIIKTAIENLREQELADSAVSGGGSTKSGTTGGFTSEDLKTMSIEKLTELAKKEAKK